MISLTPLSVILFLPAKSGKGWSCFGPDGFPYGAWSSGGEQAHTTLASVAENMCSGAEVPEGFNDFLTVLPPQGSKPEGKVHVVQVAEDARPLSLHPGS